MRARLLAVLVIVGAGAGLAACFALSIADGTVKCLPGSRPCPSGYFCSGDGLCYKNGHTGGGGSGGGAGGAGGSSCGDTQSDPLNCGACGHDCTALAHVATAAGVACVSGRCSVPASSCSAGFGHCSSNPDDGCEADLSQPAHCGGCNACPSATPLCASTGTGSYSCALSCQGSTPDQCGSTCTNLQSDPQHCHSCSTSCSYAHAIATCVQGACMQGDCNTGYMHCSSDPSSGCETYVKGSDANNCGGCGVKCKVGQLCNAGTCVENQVTCATPGITCQQPGCYQSGKYSISAGGGIVVDLGNGRNLWTRATRSSTGHNAAVSDCNLLVLEGINGWRMPTYAELSELNYMVGGLQGCPTCDPAIDQSAFPDTAAGLQTSPDNAYWSNSYNSTRMGWDSANYCDGRNNYQDPGTGLGVYRCIHDPGP